MSCKQDTDARDSVLAFTSWAPLHYRISLRTSHDHRWVFDLRPDEVHSNHSGQVVHTHLVDGTVQLDFVQEPMGNQETPFQTMGSGQERAIPGPKSTLVEFWLFPLFPEWSERTLPARV